MRCGVVVTFAERIPYEPRRAFLTSTRERLGDDTIVASVGLPVEALTAKERAVLRLLPTALTSGRSPPSCTCR